MSGAEQSSEESELILHGQQIIEGLEYDDDIGFGNTPVRTRKDSVVKSRPSDLKIKGDHQTKIPLSKCASSETPSPKPQVCLNPPSMNQVYTMATNVGCCIDSLNQELGQDRLQPLTQSIIPMLDFLEKTVAQTQQLSKMYQAQEMELSTTRQRFEDQAQKMNDLDDDYQYTVNMLSEQLESLQTTQNRFVSDWSFEDTTQNTHVEENLASALKQAQDKIEKLNKSIADTKKEQVKRRDTLASGSEATGSPVSKKDNDSELGELTKVLNEKNFYKQKCFALEDELRELKGVRAPTLDSPIGITAVGNHNTVAAPATWAVSQTQISKTLSSYFTGFLGNPASASK